MNLDDFKETWQTNIFITEEKDMHAIHTMIEQETNTLLGRLARRYGRVVTSSLIGAALFVIFFYTISDGFRESPVGVLLGLLLMLTVTAVAWRRYTQVANRATDAPLKAQLQQLLAQARRNLLEEQLLVVGLPLLFLIVSRMMNGRGTTGLLETGSLLGLGVMAVFTVGLLVVIRRRYHRDIKALEALLSQLNG